MHQQSNEFLSSLVKDDDNGTLARIILIVFSMIFCVKLGNALGKVWLGLCVLMNNN